MSNVNKMSKIHELIYNSDTGHNLNYFQREMIESRMKEYAEWYLEQFKKRCNDYLIADENGRTMITETEFNQIPNPPHE